MTRNKISNAGIQSAFSEKEINRRFPPILTIAQVAELLQVSKSTIYQWSSQGMLDFAKSERGRRPRFWRDLIISWLFGNRGN